MAGRKMTAGGPDMAVACGAAGMPAGERAAPLLSGQEIAAFRSELWAFYREHGRKLPWRHTDDPYRVLLSELMLQQTQVARVLPKFEAWLQRFPDLRSLAEAPLPDVLALWNGLGYNRRAIYLQKACREVLSRYGGVFPRTEADLRALPGIGPYTAGAVCAFAFNLPAVFVETNIRAVFIQRFFSDASEKVDDREILPLVAQTLDAENPREWYYALMDYGAELKRTVTNPTRRSRQYTRQSRFEGSFRQARGAILRQLTRQPSARLEEIAAAEGIELARIEAAARKLVQEDIIRAEGSRFCIRQD